MFIVNRRHTTRQSARRKLRGVSLLEVLISILLSAIGLLALAGANVASIRYSKLSQYRGTATVLALDLGERIRANKAGLPSYNYEINFAAQAAAIAPDTTCETYVPAACTPAALASYDLNTWRRIVRAHLPSGSVFVRVVDALGNTGCVGVGCVAADVWLVWQDPAVAAPDENSTDSRNAALECPNGLTLGGDKSIRCGFFRINL